MTELDLKFYFSLFLRRLHYFVAVTLLISVLGIMVSYVLPPVFRAEALLLVESPQIPDEMAESTVRTAAPEQLEIIKQRLLTRAELLDLSREFEIHRRAGFSPDEIVADMRDRIRISLPGVRDVAIFVTVSFDAPTALLSARVTNELVTRILAENVALRTGVAGQTLDFFEQEVERLTDELAVQGARITEFKQLHEGALPDSLDYRRNRLVALQERHLQGEREFDRLRERRERLIEIYQRTGQVALEGTGTSADERRLRDLELELEQVREFLNPENPRIRIRIQTLERQIEALRASVTGVDGQGADGMTAYDLQMADIDGQIAYLEEQQEALATEIAALEAALEATPANAIALDVLERDYENIRLQYSQAADRLAQAITGDRIEALSKGQRITVIEQAVVPDEPASPNRPLIALGSVALGMAAGAALVAAIELLNRAIRRPADLTNALGITPFATIPYIRTEEEIRRRRVVMITVLVFGVVGLPLLVLSVHIFYLPIDLLIDKIMDAAGISGFLERVRMGRGG
ncbi:GumC family protein [Pelagovum sp. HNIBRBA483]|uniref:GumC family protein n=1 Tax=Pelagovum sp. HNIBRBA483 TaxID=3233341 RepID=UPI0034A34D71